MAYAYVIISLLAAATALLFPFSVKVKYHFSLNREKSVVVLKIMFFTLAHVTVFNEKQTLKVTLNGKNVPLKRKKEGSFPAEKIPKVFAFINSEKIIAGAYIFAYVGGNDAMDCALKLALLETLASTVLKQKDIAAYPDFQNDRLDFDIRLRANISLLQTLELIVLLGKTKKSEKAENAET